MKLAFFDDFSLGVVEDDRIVDVSDLVGDIARAGPQELLNGLIVRFEAYRGKLERAAADRQGVPVSGVRLRSPAPKPGNIACMAVNYMENGALKEKPVINAFQKAASGVIGDGDVMVLPDVPAVAFEGEAELAAVIGKRAENVGPGEALSHVFGWLNFIDGSARGLKPFNFYTGKARATFAPLGPYLVTADEVPDPQNLRVRSWTNGRLMQDYSTSDMAHDIRHSIAWLSAIHPLEVGDMVAFGTNHRGLNPLQDGDKLEMEVEGLGRLHVAVRDDLKRTWPRETRLERNARGEEGPSPQLAGKYAPAEP